MAAAESTCCASSAGRSALPAASQTTRRRSGLGLKSTVPTGRVRCSCEGRVRHPVVWAAAIAATWSPSALGLVDERMSTEGTGLPFGLSNNVLGWILIGVFTVIWALYFSYTSSLDEDDDSGLSL